MLFFPLRAARISLKDQCAQISRRRRKLQLAIDAEWGFIKAKVCFGKPSPAPRRPFEKPS